MRAPKKVRARVIAERQHCLRLILRRHDGAHVTLLIERRVLERVQQSDIRLLVVGLLLQQARLEVASLLACKRRRQQSQRQEHRNNVSGASQQCANASEITPSYTAIREARRWAHANDATSGGHAAVASQPPFTIALEPHVLALMLLLPPLLLPVVPR